MKRAAWTGLLLCLCWPLAVTGADEDTLAGDKEQQKEVLADWLSGRFSNFHQLAVAGDASGYPALVQETHIISLPDGDATKAGLLTSQAWLQEPEQPYRRQFSTLHTPRWWQSHLRQRLYYVPEDIPLADLQYEDLEYLSGCDIHWEFDDGTFTGWRGDEDSCAFRDTSGHQVSLNSHLELTPDQLSIQDSAEATQAPGLFGDVSGATVNLQPIQFIVGEIRFVPSGMSDDEDSWLTVEPARQLHDQGQRTALLTTESRQALPYELEIQRQSSAGDMLLRVFRHGQTGPVAEEHLAPDEAPWQVQVGRLVIELQTEPFQPPATD